ncbi:aliphatic sulfonate ABC transporter permease SsuC [Bacillus sp. FJAT-42376]|uniref:aliphatic sulfonate ABC transporter permease SsuC n=1 Tax=Bacillus sp. FJAT-42376 TaxID=2014076 RepID=UPI000F4DC47F|nr:aliphatic sulfonate ABC transporter permease SsuC [Bacillus sp. FJAT-42376]AZB41915.1 aliphatic sulfonate ABC transporter permease SsuC [Bacillus sp. FJAT-42376]
MADKVLSFKNSLAAWGVPVLLIVLWQVLSMTGLLSEKILPAPSAVFAAAVALTESGDLFNYIGISSQRAIIGFIIGGGIGFALGLLNGLSSKAETLLDTSVQMLRNIPHLALIPLVILWFGIEEEAKIFLVALGVLFPIYLNTYHGLKSIDKGLIEAARVYGLKGFSLFWHVILPAALPSILVGVRFSLGVMWITLIVAETISANSGIGYMAMNAREFLQMDVVVLSIILYALLGKLSDVLAKILEKKCLKWHPSYQ